MAPFAGITFLGRPTQGAADTHNGARNKPNEDRFITFTGPGDNSAQTLFLVVADGVTSTHGGERASDIAVRVLRDLLQAAPANGKPPRPLRDRMADAIHRANQEILETARKDPELKGMSTTLVIAAVDGDQLTLMHLGDSRAYLIRNEKAHLLSRDHTWVQEALEEGRITPQQAANHPNKHVILRYLGDVRGLSIDQGIFDPDKPAVAVDETEVGRQYARTGDTSLKLRAGDRLLLCSDGLYNRITDAEIAAVVSTQPPERAVRWLIDEAVKRQEPDNITVVLWTSAEGNAAPVAAIKSRRPALLLAAAGALLAIIAFLLLGRSNEQPGVLPSTPAAVAAAAAETTPPQSEAPPPADTPPADTPTTEGSPTDETTATAAPSAESPTPNVETFTSTPYLTSTPDPAAQPTIAETPPDATTDNGPTRTPRPTSTGLPPTATPVATPTSTPSGTPTSTRTPRPATPPPAAGTPPGGETATAPSAPAANQQGGPTAATIEAPSEGETSSNPTRFKWSVNAALAPGQAFEVLFWRQGEDARIDGKPVLGAAPATETTLPVQSLAQGSYRWSVWLVQVEPAYERLRQLSEPRTFTVSSAGGGSPPSDGLPPSDGEGEK
jgi:protein phosphatase